MFLKDHLKDTYKKASLDNNHLVIQYIINKWAHRFGVESLSELIVKKQDQMNLIEEEMGDAKEDQMNLIEEEMGDAKEDQMNLIEEEMGDAKEDQMNLIGKEMGDAKEDQMNLIEEEMGDAKQDQINLKSLANFQSQEEIKSSNNNKIIYNENFQSRNRKSGEIKNGELPLPNINNLRKWINNKKEAS